MLVIGTWCQSLEFQVLHKPVIGIAQTSTCLSLEGLNLVQQLNMGFILQSCYHIFEIRIAHAVKALNILQCFLIYLLENPFLNRRLHNNQLNVSCPRNHSQESIETNEVRRAKPKLFTCFLNITTNLNNALIH